MYEWRAMTPKEREEVLAFRKDGQRPWHGPPHEERGEGRYHITAACYEHAPIIGAVPGRLAECERLLLEAIAGVVDEISAWCVLPNHYHLLVTVPTLKVVVRALGLFHGRLSHAWNGEDSLRGRKVWHACADRAIRSERHYWVTMNYIHNNPVRHGHARKWTDWPYSSACAFIGCVGRDEAKRIWKEYPMLDYGKGWDEY